KNAALTPAQLAGATILSGHIKWQPFNALHLTDSYSARLKALVNSGPQSITILAFNGSPSERKNVIYTAVLSGATVTSFHQSVHSQQDEEILFTFTTITWTWR